RRGRLDLDAHVARDAVGQGALDGDGAVADRELAQVVGGVAGVERGGDAAGLRAAERRQIELRQRERDRAALLVGGLESLHLHGVPGEAGGDGAVLTQVVDPDLVVQQSGVDRRALGEGPEVVTAGGQERRHRDLVRRVGTDLSVVNPGGLRSDLLFKGTGGSNADGVVTFAEANAVLPFTNNLSSVSLTGAQLTQVFEEQWQRDAAGNVPSRPYLQLGTSSNVAYTFDPTRPEGERITSLRVDGEQVGADTTYKVAVPSFLASGGDNFRTFAEGTAVDTGLLDYEVWIDYLGENSPVAPSFARHAVQVEGLQSSYDEGGTVSFTLPKLDLTSLGSPQTRSVTATLYSGDTPYD
ncbi:MAG: hypothetical protein EON53_17820, partial [Actinomycetales bacterium]